jgi:hypothetical protein
MEKENDKKKRKRRKMSRRTKLTSKNNQIMNLTMNRCWKLSFLVRLKRLTSTQHQIIWVIARARV